MDGTTNEDDSRKLYVILEEASLETVKVGKSFELLNGDRHKGLLAKHKRDPAELRPDIAHQCLLMLLDSPLNKADMLRVFVHTKRNALIEISPQTRIPRTFDRFCGLMVQLLHKLCVRAADTSVKLMKVVKNPVTAHLPVGCVRIGTSFHSKELVDPRSLVPSSGPIAFVIGAMAHGSIGADYIERSVSISNYPLSAALVCAKVCSAFEDVWGIR